MIQKSTKKIAFVDKSTITDGIIFLIGLAVFTTTLLLLKNAVASYVNTQKAIASSLLASSINDAQIAALNKVSIKPDTFINALPNQKTVIQWVQQTEIMAKIANVAQTVNFSNGTLTKDGILINQQTAGSNNTIPVNIVLRGKYSQVLSYIQMLNDSYYYTKIDGVTFTSIRSTTSSSQGSVSVSPTPVQAPNQYVTATLTMELFVQDITSQISQ